MPAPGTDIDVKRLPVYECLKEIAPQAHPLSLVKVVNTGKDKRHAASQAIHITHPGIRGRQFYYSILSKAVATVPAKFKGILELSIAIWTEFHVPYLKKLISKVPGR